MTYKFYGDGEMEIIPYYETNELTIWIEGSFGCNSFTLDENNIDDVIEVLTKFKNKQTKWNHLSSN